jgi:hypothetical protein
VSGGPAAVPGSRRPAGGRVKGGELTTVGFLKRWNVVLPVLIAAAGLVGVFGSFVVQAAARATSEATGPALIEVQDLFASVAEANTAATAAHLAVDVTGEEDRISRNLYDEALRRSNQHLAEVSADIGQASEAQVELQNIGASLAAYSGEVEAARIAKLNGLPDADGRLRSALGILNSEIGPSVNAITDFGRQRYDDEAGEGQILLAIALALGLGALGAMGWMQFRLAHRTRRVFNPLLVLSTLALIGVIGLLAYGNVVRLLALNDADAGGYDAIGASAEIQNTAFDLQSQLALLLLDESGRSGATRTADIDGLVATGDERIGGIIVDADSDRERAAAETLVVRWQRYLNVVDDIKNLDSAGNRQAAVVVFETDGLAAFNGVNTAIESVLLDNRLQFSDGVAVASDAVELNPWLCLLLAITSGLLAVVAIQRRLGDYR